MRVLTAIVVFYYSFWWVVTWADCENLPCQRNTRIFPSCEKNNIHEYRILIHVRRFSLKCIISGPVVKKIWYIVLKCRRAANTQTNMTIRAVSPVPLIHVRAYNSQNMENDEDQDKIRRTYKMYGF